MPKFPLSTRVLLTVISTLGVAIILLALRISSKSSIVPEAVNDAEAGESRELRITRLKEMVKQQDELISHKQSALAELQTALLISDVEANSAVRSSEPATLVNDKRMRARGVAMDLAFIEALSQLTKVERRKAILAARPDPKLMALAEQREAAELKLSARVEVVSPDGPEAKSIELLITSLNEEIDNRVDDLVAELKVVVARNREALNVAKAQSAESALRRRSFFEAKRELDGLKEARQRMNLDLQQERFAARLWN